LTVKICQKKVFQEKEENVFFQIFRIKRKGLRERFCCAFSIDHKEITMKTIPTQDKRNQEKHITDELVNCSR